MIEVTETVVKSYDLDGLIERVKSLESSLDAIKFYDFLLLICLVLFAIGVLLFANGLMSFINEYYGGRRR